MILYLLIFILLTAFFYQYKYAGDKNYLGLVMAFLTLFVGMSDMLGGYDRYIYCELFDKCADFIQKDLNPYTDDNPIMGYKSEIGYVTWNVLLGHITKNRYIFILLTASVTYILIYKSLKDYVVDYPFALLLFMALWFFFTFTYLRQTMAASFAWLSYRWIIKNKLIPFLICAFIAYKFHNSAIVFLPLFFLPLKKYSKKTIIWGMVILLLIGLTGLPSALYTVYGEASDTESRTSGYSEDNPGARFAYVFEVIVFLGFILRKYDKILPTRKNLVFLNAALCFCAMLLFFIKSSNAGRQSWYYMIGIIYILTYLVKKEGIKSEFTRNLWVVLFLLYMRIVIAWGGLLSPYKTFLTNGYREEDPIIRQYEYDWNYEKDKLYRSVWALN